MTGRTCFYSRCRKPVTHEVTKRYKAKVPVVYCCDDHVPGSGLATASKELQAIVAAAPPCYAVRRLDEVRCCEHGCESEGTVVVTQGNAMSYRKCDRHAPGGLDYTGSAVEPVSWTERSMLSTRVVNDPAAVTTFWVTA